MPTQWVDASADGTRVLLRTVEPRDRERHRHRVRHLRAHGGRHHDAGVDRPRGRQPAGADVFYEGASADGTRVFFRRVEPLVASDTDDCEVADPQPNPCTDVYEWSNGVTTLVVGGRQRRVLRAVRGASEDGSRVVFTHPEQLSGADTDTTRRPLRARRRDDHADVHRPAGQRRLRPHLPRRLGRRHARVLHDRRSSSSPPTPTARATSTSAPAATTTRLSTGPAGGNGAHDASFRGASSDGTPGVRRDQREARRLRHRQRDRRLRALRRDDHPAVDRPGRAATARRTRC